jgi:uncharacterized membrane protein YgdD (TMEM256/DUF423 family)
VSRVFLVLGSLSAFAGVAIGAFGAHGLKKVLGAEQLAVFEIGVRYQIYHALGLLAVAWACSRWPGRAAAASGWLFVGGTVLFSGSLYALAMSGAKWLGAVTPLGGLAFMAGWLCLAWAAWKSEAPTAP